MKPYESYQMSISIQAGIDQAPARKNSFPAINEAAYVGPWQTYIVHADRSFT